MIEEQQCVTSQIYRLTHSVLSSLIGFCKCKGKKYILNELPMQSSEVCRIRNKLP